jgi:hypothetical protein
MQIMGSFNKSCVLSIVIIFVFSLIFIQSATSEASAANSNSPAIEWKQTIATGNTEEVSNIVQTSDGGYAFLDPGWGHQGFSVSTFYKLNSSGNIQWKQHNSSIWARSFIQTNDNKYELFGSWISKDYSMWGTGKTTPAVFKIDQNGNLRSALNTSIFRGSPTNDGGFLIIGSYRLIGNLTKINSFGIRQWSTVIQEPGNHSSVSQVIQTRDGGYALVGSTSFNGTSDTPNLYIWIAKIDSHGNLEWSNRFGNGPSSVDNNSTQNAGALDNLNRRTLGDNEGISIVETSDGGLGATGIVYPLRNYSWWGFSYNPDPNMAQTILIRTDSQGNLQWNQTFAGYETSPIIETTDNGFAFATHGQIVKADINGQFQWSVNVTFPSSGGMKPLLLDVSYILETSDGGLLWLGVGPIFQSWQGNIYLTKTVAFLPSPTPLKLQPPIPILENGKILVDLPLLIAIIVILISAIVTLFLVFRRHQKTQNNLIKKV